MRNASARTGSCSWPRARRLHLSLLPIYTGIFRTQGAMLVKAGLRVRGLDVGAPRLPLVEATDDEV